MHWLEPPFNMIISGRTGCGKTHFVLDLLSSVYRNKFTSIVIFCPTYDMNKTYNRLFLKNDPNIIVIPPDHIKDKLDDWLAVSTEKYADEIEQTLFLIDDCANMKASKVKSSELTKLAFSGRHMNISVWILTQKYNAVVKDFRENVRMLVLYHQKDKNGLKQALEENDSVPKNEEDAIALELRESERARLIIRIDHPVEYEIEG